MPKKLLLVVSTLGLCLTLRAATIVACVGDSITFGSHVEDRDHNSYPAVLGQLLGSGYAVSNYGVSGATMLKAGDKPYWNQKAYKEAMASHPAIVVLMLGTNDSKPQNFAHEADFEKDALDMIASFRALPSKPAVYLCLPCPVFKTMYTISEEKLAPLREILGRVATEAKTPVIDMNRALAGQPEKIDDGVHPKASGARVMAEAVASALKG